jgi:hypothetical protein
MRSVAQKGSRMSLYRKFSRLADRLRDPEWRRYGTALLTGKLMGIGLVLLLVTVISGLFLRLAAGLRSG